MTKTKKIKPGTVCAIVLLLGIIACSVYGYMQFFYEPAPIRATAIFKRPQWAPKQVEIELYEYGDNVKLKIDNVTYQTDCEAITAWLDNAHIKKDTSKTYSFKLTVPDDRTITGYCYEPIALKDQQDAIIIDTDQFRYYTSKSSLELTPVN